MAVGCWFGSQFHDHLFKSFCRIFHPDQGRVDRLCKSDWNKDGRGLRFPQQREIPGVAKERDLAGGRLGQGSGTRNQLLRIPGQLAARDRGQFLESESHAKRRTAA